MRIEIDTHHDSKDAIKKAIQLLHELVDEPFSNSPYPASPPTSAPSSGSENGFFNLFGPVDAPSSQGSSLGSSPLLPPADASSAPRSSSVDQGGESVFDIFRSDAPSDSSSFQRQPSPLPSANPLSLIPPRASAQDLLDESKPRSYDEEYDDPSPSSALPPKPHVVKESDLKAKKFNMPSDQISVIEY